MECDSTAIACDREKGHSGKHHADVMARQRGFHSLGCFYWCNCEDCRDDFCDCPCHESKELEPDWD